MKPDKGLHEGLMGGFMLVEGIGGCKRPHEIADAVREASMVASVI